MPDNKKATCISLIIFGLLFLALGVFLFIVQSGTVVVMIIAGIDALFGVALIIGGAATSKASSGFENRYGDSIDDDDDDYADRGHRTREAAAAENPRNHFSRNPEREEAAYNHQRFEREPDQRFRQHREPVDRYELPDMNEPVVEVTRGGGIEDLTAREIELRATAKRAAEEATRLKKSATAAALAAKHAEEELSRAEKRLPTLNPAEQRGAMRDIDRLSQIAMEKSEAAVSEARKAKIAIRNAKSAAEEHNRAMDAAAAAMMEMEADEFN